MSNDSAAPSGNKVGTLELSLEVTGLDVAVAGFERLTAAAKEAGAAFASIGASFQAPSADIVARFAEIDESLRRKELMAAEGVVRQIALANEQVAKLNEINARLQRQIEAEKVEAIALSTPALQTAAGNPAYCAAFAEQWVKDVRRGSDIYGMVPRTPLEFISAFSKLPAAQ